MTAQSYNLSIGNCEASLKGKLDLKLLSMYDELFSSLILSVRKAELPYVLDIVDLSYSNPVGVAGFAKFFLLARKFDKPIRIKGSIRHVWQNTGMRALMKLWFKLEFIDCSVPLELNKELQRLDREVESGKTLALS